jgi:hypothetical protein
MVMVGTIYHVLQDYRPYIEAVAKYGEVVAGKMLVEGKLVNAPRDQIFYSLDAARNFWRGTGGGNKPAPYAAVIALHTVPGDIGAGGILSGAFRTWKPKGIAKPVVEDEITLNHGGKMKPTAPTADSLRKGSVSRGLTGETRSYDPKTQTDMPILHFNTEGATRAGLGAPTPTAIKVMTMMAIKRALNDLLHPHFNLDIKFSVEPGVTGGSFIEFYKDPYKWVKASKEKITAEVTKETSKLEAEAVKNLQDKGIVSDKTSPAEFDQAVTTETSRIINEQVNKMMDTATKMNKVAKSSYDRFEKAYIINLADITAAYTTGVLGASAGGLASLSRVAVANKVFSNIEQTRGATSQSYLSGTPLGKIMAVATAAETLRPSMDFTTPDIDGKTRPLDYKVGDTYATPSGFDTPDSQGWTRLTELGDRTVPEWIDSTILTRKATASTEIPMSGGMSTIIRDSKTSTPESKSTIGEQTTSLSEIRTEASRSTPTKPTGPTTLTSISTTTPDKPTTPTKPTTHPPPPPPDKHMLLLPNLPRGGTTTQQIPEGSLTWKQGLFWKWIPRSDFKDGVKPRTLPQGVTPIGAKNTHLRTPSDTIQVVGKGSVPDIRADLGKTDLFITNNARNIVFKGRGEKTNVGERVTSNTTGMTIGEGTGVNRTTMTGFYPQHSVSRLDMYENNPPRKGKSTPMNKDGVADTGQEPIEEPAENEMPDNQPMMQATPIESETVEAQKQFDKDTITPVNRTKMTRKATSRKKRISEWDYMTTLKGFRP